MHNEKISLPLYHLLFTGAGAAVITALMLLMLQAFTPLTFLAAGFCMHLVLQYGYSYWREGPRWATDRTMRVALFAALLLALLPLLSLLGEVTSRGLKRLLGPYPGYFWITDMAGVIGGMQAGGIAHGILGTLLITFAATIISVPIGLATAIFLTEYTDTPGRRVLGKGITFLVDVMTGIPSIVAGLFALALFVTITGEQGIRIGFMGAVALSLLMIPTVVRSSEEMLRLVPAELREASLALGVPKWLTSIKVVVRTALAGITTGVTLAIARIIGETAPLLLTIGLVPVINTNLFGGRMATLPTYINSQYKLGNAVCHSDTVTNPITQMIYPCSTSINLDRAWAAALTLILLVMLLNLVARLVSRYFSAQTTR